ncbi:MAG: hypothetical protein Q9226_006189 [Calogaya cf. arnoldii]
MFLLPWTSAARNEKVAMGNVAPPSPQWPCSSTTERSLLNRKKRKRQGSDDSGAPFQSATPQVQHLSYVNIPTAMDPHFNSLQSARSHNGRNIDTGSLPSLQDRTERTDWQPAHNPNQPIRPQPRAPQPKPPSVPPPATQANVTLARRSLPEVQDAIESQFGLKILLKHRELRLIDQEIAKCQIALEQLRRCQVIPYPAMTSSWEEMQAVANGTGPIRSNGAENAPPEGVTNGPYTRHYRHWLIPDTAFGDRLTEEVPVAQPPRTGSDRSVRASTAGKSGQVNQTQNRGGQGSAKLKALPHGYPEAKEDKGPVVLKRLSDGKMVKLICPGCDKSSFNSVQGFINHSRIAHMRLFKTHEAAAIACGEEVELDQAGRIIGESGTASASTAGLVHPLITAKIPKPEPSTVGRSGTPGVADSNSQLLPHTPASSIAASSVSASTPFQPSPQTPYLSEFISKRGGGIDLEEEVNLAMIKYDADADVLSDDDEENDAELEDAEAACSPGEPINHSTRGVVRPDHPPSRVVILPSQTERPVTVKPAKPGSRRPKDLTGLPSHSTPTTSTKPLGGFSHDGPPPLNHYRRIHDEAASPNLSPNTVESHQAPSLISDDDDFENTYSECSSTADIAEDLERHYFGMDFEGHDEHAMEELEGASSSAGASHLGLGAEIKGGHAPRRSSAMRSPDTIHNPIINNGERHVSFASPMQRPRKKGSK